MYPNDVRRSTGASDPGCIYTSCSAFVIFPLSSYSNGHSQVSFLNLLGLFASPDIAYNVSTYLGLLPSPSGLPQPPSQLKINRLENLITLYQPAHSYLDDGKIILGPVGDPLSIFDSTNPANPPALTHYSLIFSYAVEILHSGKCTLSCVLVYHSISPQPSYPSRTRARRMGSNFCYPD